MTEQICQIGFCCPYHRYNDEGDEMCIYPHVFLTENEDGETFGIPEEIDCPLVTLDSELNHWLMMKAKLRLGIQNLLDYKITVKE